MQIFCDGEEIRLNVGLSAGVNAYERAGVNAV